jgi:hypothetical protein
MAYIGNSPANVGNYQIVDDISSSFNGSLTSFALASGGITITPSKSGQLLVGVNGVMQEPDDTGANGFKVSGSNVVFSSPPASGDTFWAVYQGQNVDIGVPSDDVVDTVHIKDGAITGAKIAAGTVVASDIADGSITAAKVAADVATQAELDTVSGVASAALPKSGGAMTGAITTNSTFDGRDVSVDGTKLDGIEANATADQTAAQIKTAYESNSDTNEFSDAEKTKLSNIGNNSNNYSHPNHSGEVTSTGDGATVIADNVVDEANLKVSNTPTNGYFLSAQSGNTGGMTWAEVDALPSQSGNSGKYLTTNGSAASWAVLDTDANTTTKGLYEHAHTIAANYSITSGNNALTAGPITINSGISVTIPTGSTWIVA